jgi:hypothetical protein
LTIYLGGEIIKSASKRDFCFTSDLLFDRFEKREFFSAGRFSSAAQAGGKMAIVNYYVQPNGDDNNSGQSHAEAKATINGVISALADPIADEVCVNIFQNTCENPNVYQETGGLAKLVGLRGLGYDSKLTIRTYYMTGDPPSVYHYFNDSAYNSGSDPYDLGGEYDPMAAKPVAVCSMLIRNCSIPICVKGMWIMPSSSQPFAIQAENSSDVNIVYTTVNDRVGGFGSVKNSFVTVEGSASMVNNWGAVCGYGSQMVLLGSNYFYDSKNGGILCHTHSTVIFRFQNTGSQNRFVTGIFTITPHRKYAGMKAMANSQLVVEDPDVNPSQERSAIVTIFDEKRSPGPEYYGVVLESMSMLLGAANVKFFHPEDALEQKPTIPEEKQFWGDESEGTVIIK